MPCASCTQLLLQRRGIIKIVYPRVVVENYILRGEEKTAEIREAEQKLRAAGVKTSWLDADCDLLDYVHDPGQREQVIAALLAWHNNQLPPEQRITEF